MSTAPTPAPALHARDRARAMRRGWPSLERALRHACAYPHPAGRIVRIETHLSVVYLAGRYAYKLKKPVAYGFVDYSTPALRAASCRAELRLNRPLAKPLYLEVVPIARRARSFKVGARGDTVEHAVKMARFDERDVFSALLARGELGPRDVDGLAQRLAASHRHAPRRPPRPAFGTAASVGAQLGAALDALEAHAPRLVPGEVRAWCSRELARLAAQLDARRAAGFVRACHGDLHLANVVRHGRDVLMFDCIEFNDALRWIDVVNDLAFPVMDLLAHGAPTLAARVVNRWVGETGDFAGLATLRLFVVYRALVRTLVAVLAARGSQTPGPVPQATRYLRVVACASEPAPAFLLLCHGLSGSGKSAASEALAPLIGAVRVSSDLERKRAAPLDAPGRAALPPAAYTRDAVHALYERLASHADTLLANGYPVIVDASFLAREHRARFLRLAHERAVPAWILDFRAAPERLVERVRARAAQPGGPSDADEAVLRRQFASAEPLAGDELALTLGFDTEVPLADFASPAFWRVLRECLPASNACASRR
jgi:aminoglycoside phosphotransferase family enzyme/predicted kinase